MNSSVKIVVTVLAMGLLWSACKKENNFPDEPVISFDSYERYGNDSLHVIIKFTDGDGDIGFRDQDTLPPYDFVPLASSPEVSSNSFYYNVILRQQDLVNGVWQELPIEVAPRTYYRISDISPSGQDPTLEGEMRIKMNGALPLQVSEDSDSSKFTIQLIDRALNESNITETPIIITN